MMPKSMEDTKALIAALEERPEHLTTIDDWEFLACLRVEALRSRTE